MILGRDVLLVMVYAARVNRLRFIYEVNCCSIYVLSKFNCRLHST